MVAREALMSSASPLSSPAAERVAVEARIRSLATDMFVRDGYNGVSFLAIGKALGITHSNIHYYFKTKSALAEACLQEYAAATLMAYQAIWLDPALDLLQKFVATRDWAYGQYLRYNPGGTGGAQWGMLDRFANDAHLLSPGIKHILRETSRGLDRCLEEGISISIRRGELGADTPIADTRLQVSSVLYSSRQVTRYGGTFDRLDDLLRTTYTVIRLAYGDRERPVEWPRFRSPGAAKGNDGKNALRSSWTKAETRERQGCGERAPDGRRRSRRGDHERATT